MPQGRRKIAFSGKKKKVQLAAKKQAKIVHANPFLLNKTLKEEGADDAGRKSEDLEVQKLNYQPGRDGRYVFHFYRESDRQVKEAKEVAKKPLNPVPPQALEVGDNFFVGYGFPQRPPWHYEMSKEKLEWNENKYFRDYMQNLEKVHYDDKKILSFCELNLETWRQLWRVLEISDIFLLIVDIRFPTLMFPPSVYQHVQELGKSMILVLNKIDLVPPAVVLAWKKYFEEKYPQLHILAFTSFPSYNLRGPQGSSTGVQIRRRRGKMRMAAEGAYEVYKAVNEIVGGSVDIASWESKILEELNLSDGEEEDAEPETPEVVHEEEKDLVFQKYVRHKNGILTIGCLGFPNVGKSSLMNALMGQKVVSVSRTPGHTKHFQTIFLTQNVRLCDCPGLVFPSSAPRSLQVLMGSYPIAQLREPYAAIRYLCERVDLISLLALKHEYHDPEDGWSPIVVCDEWAVKRGFLTAKVARPATYRSANHLLRMALDGKFNLHLLPPDFIRDEASWLDHPELKDIIAIQSKDPKLSEISFVNFTDSEDENEESSEEEGDDKGDSSSIPTTSNVFSLLNADGI